MNGSFCLVKVKSNNLLTKGQAKKSNQVKDYSIRNGIYTQRVNRKFAVTSTMFSSCEYHGFFFFVLFCNCSPGSRLE